MRATAKVWSKIEIEEIEKRYPLIDTRDVADYLGVTTRQIDRVVQRLSARKINNIANIAYSLKVTLKSGMIFEEFDFPTGKTGRQRFLAKLREINVKYSEWLEKEECFISITHDYSNCQY